MTTPLEQKARECAEAIHETFPVLPENCALTYEIILRHFTPEEQPKISPPEHLLDKCCICGDKPYRIYPVCKKHMREEQPKDQPHKFVDELAERCEAYIANLPLNIGRDRIVSAIVQAILEAQEPLKIELEETRQHLADAVKAVLDARDILDPSKSELSLIHCAELISENTDSLSKERDQLRLDLDTANLCIKGMERTQQILEQENATIDQLKKELVSEKKHYEDAIEFLTAAYLERDQLKQQLKDLQSPNPADKSYTGVVEWFNKEVEGWKEKVKELEKDKERLDWLTGNFYLSNTQECKSPYKSWVFHVPSKEPYTELREAIDTAILKGEQKITSSDNKNPITDKELLDWAEIHSIDCRDRVYITINREMIREAMKES